MTLSGKVLLVPERRDSERDAVAEHWRSAGGRVVRLGRFWDPPPLPEAGLRPYGNDTFCLVLAQKLDLRELSPPDDLLVHLDAAVLGRRVALTTPRRARRAPRRLCQARVRQVGRAQAVHGRRVRERQRRPRSRAGPAR
ncbi:hypothetical protein PPSIR1_18857 [Plesiocystis pacifica SIR-1]|uniref:Uncharacterized protein n=1 Tax=Plesiocystis pacifica SIR-1 TaxID=391625 RepID=A6GBI7_9BACT|nr:hypothetical protein [Plesiocystis pacifica]EDM76791.1 hypothetical protein PPSIR1_18857 [Plesiocystis pacifica SIR-1]